MVRRNKQCGSSIAILCAAFLATWSYGLAGTARADVTIAPLRPATNYFAGSEQRLSFAIKSDAPLKGRLHWTYAAGVRTISHGSNDIVVAADRPAEVTIALMLPPVRPGVVFSTQLSLEVIEEGAEEPLAQLVRPVWLFDENPLADQTLWLRSLEIGLYDPAKKTAALFDKIDLPYTWLRNLSAVEERAAGLLVIGEDVSLVEQRGLADVAIEKFSAGLPVLWLSPREGDVPLARVSEAPDTVRLDWRKNEIISVFDKRLDVHAWSPQGTVPRRGLLLTIDDGQVVARVSDDEAAWPWLEAEGRQPQQRLIVCGFRVVDAWPDSPTPRHLLRHVLQKFHHSTPDQPTSKDQE